MPNSKTYVGLYGKVAILKSYCSECEGFAFVIDGVLACCDTPLDSTPTHFKRESEPVRNRRKPSLKVRQAKLQEQNYRCFYCERHLESIVYKKGKQVRLRVHYDHQVPFAYIKSNDADNFVAACHVCNGIKSDLCFQSLAEAKIYIESQWHKKKYLNFLYEEENEDYSKV